MTSCSLFELSLACSLLIRKKNAILNAVSEYDEQAAKVIKKVIKLSGDKLATLLEHLQCTQDQLPQGTHAQVLDT